MKKSKEDTVKELMARYQQLKDNRAKFESWWTEAQTFCDNGVLSWSDVDSLPTKPKRYSSLPYNYAKTLVAGIVGYSISPSVNWFKLSIENQELLNSYGVKDFLERAEKVLYAEFNKSNLYREAVPFVKDAVIPGHGVLQIDEDVKNMRLRFTKHPVNELYLDVNEYGEVDTVFRYYVDTLRNAADFFGIDNLHEDVREDAKDPRKWNTKIELLQCIFPRTEYNEEFKNAENKPIACYYIDVKQQFIIKESGFDDFPFAIFEWERLPGYAYSSSPAQDALPDIRALNIIKKSSLQIAQTSAQPPFLVDADIRDLDLTPGGKTYLPTKDSRVEAIKTGENYPITLQELSNYQQDIKDWFYVDYFLMLQNKTQNMTATEVMELQGEKAATLSSMIVALNGSLQKIIERSFNILMKQGKITNIPTALKGQSLKVEFIGPLAQSQRKYHTMGGTMQALQIAGPIMQMFPNAGDYLDGDELMKSAMEGQGMPQNVIREQEDVEKIRAQRLQQQQEQQAKAQQMAMAQSLMQNADKLNTPVEDGSLMQQMNSQMSGAMNGQ